MKRNTKIEFNDTQRGFRKGTFNDRYGELCSIQKSSLAGENAIWLGVESANPQIMVSDAVRLGLTEEPNPVGFMPYSIPNEVVMSTRMHLTQEQVKELLPILQKFAKTGEI